VLLPLFVQSCGVRNAERMRVLHLGVAIGMGVLHGQQVLRACGPPIIFVFFSGLEHGARRRFQAVLAAQIGVKTQCVTMVNKRAVGAQTSCGGMKHHKAPTARHEQTGGKWSEADMHSC
jgi:hypothetical protein